MLPVQFKVVNKKDKSGNARPANLMITDYPWAMIKADKVEYPKIFVKNNYLKIYCSMHSASDFRKQDRMN